MREGGGGVTDGGQGEGRGREGGKRGLEGIAGQHHLHEVVSAVAPVGLAQRGWREVEAECGLCSWVGSDGCSRCWPLY